MTDYVSKLPLPLTQVPQGLRELLCNEDAFNPQREVTVTHRYERNRYKDNYEYAHMTMATVPAEEAGNLKVLKESTDGLVASSIPHCTHQGGARDYNISISNYGYIVASWGGGTHFSFFLAEHVWMTLGLKPRLIGDTEQKVIFDDASQPDYNVAQGDVSSEYYFVSSKEVKWTMRNDYLRKYLWMKNFVGAKVFFYEAFIPRTKEVSSLLAGNKHYRLDLPWIEFEIADHGENVILQTWATIPAIEPVCCPDLDADTLVWPGHSSAMTKLKSSDIKNNEYVFVDDGFLTKYEKDASFDSVPYHDGTTFKVAPSYGGQWSFRDCTRLGRNIIKIPFYELYRGIPQKEIYHVFNYALDPNNINKSDLVGENIVSRTYRLAAELARLNDNLVALGSAVNVELSNSDIFEINHRELAAEGITNYPVLQKLSYVAPKDMHEQDFLSRCKTLNEIINKIKPGSLRKLLVAMGVKKHDIEKTQTLKLLQALLNFSESIIEQNEEPFALKHAIEFSDYKKPNPNLAYLFINNDLRNTEAHEVVDKSMEHLAKLGFDTATLISGYSQALDFIFDGVIENLKIINNSFEKALGK
ncbi:hypothetical protein VIW49_04695 [Enterobacter bugandensis]|uniref:hypothetical protein n=1 Tax=Enterobacter TaxID=547 RepID=UPI0013FE41F5|nr:MULTISPECIES: hypothetical protein [Enterobacter]WRU11140.1 hypothetical protein VIW49_04695 [Enterobacter bugandensis]HCM9425783.1 hypothetical protein [Enterobacter hormaechei subsp. xiangfangensis]HCM9429783.1 hypothetical protein [Enterobacter hormaechei subsp. xiangfangensis]